MTADPVEQLRRLAKRQGIPIEIVEKIGGHVQVRGALLVNWYPRSRKQTAYVAGTRHGHKRVDAAAVLRMAFEAPPVVDGPVKRRSNSKLARKRRMFEKNPYCHWCSGLMHLNDPLDQEYATTEHKIPLKRGGLDNANNRVLAHKRCNNERGHDMPELEQAKEPPLP